jgi:UDP-glucose 4-epimerase
MRILLTGHRGRIGAVTAEHLRSCGHEVVGFDVADGDELRDERAVARAMAGCDAVAHLGAIADDPLGTPLEIMSVNALGTWHVLLAAEAHSARVVVNFSSVQVFGLSQGRRLPDYLPVDDDHPRRAELAYGLSKRIGEDMCEAFTVRTGVPTVCLRPVGVWNDEQYDELPARWSARPAAEFEPAWHFGMYVDVHDVAEAVRCALDAPVRGHVRALLCAPDSAASAPPLELLRRLAPDVPLRGEDRFRSDPWASLADCSVAERELGWRARRRWSELVRGEEVAGTADLAR